MSARNLTSGSVSMLLGILLIAVALRGDSVGAPFSGRERRRPPTLLDRSFFLIVGIAAIGLGIAELNE